ncbi:lipopolysaccharide biosynthesis protein [Acinetobacter indicus]|uniref:lipopolysaccharide biosynthesis protein n=1 Tax=Acinetobacter indicus TaxID=756892 RepID=UPI001A8E60CC|nr:hypothetical protein [Acinetobacter indicus]QSQ94961.1 hypothetical protein J0W33_08250 [Acinetobacter indicus]
MRKILINIIGSLSYAFIQWFIITYISREFSISEAGVYAFYLAILSPAAIFFSFGLRNQIATDINEKFSIGGYIFLSRLGFFLFLIFSVLIFLFNNVNILIMLLVFFNKAFDLLSERIYGSWIRSSNSIKYGLSRIYKCILGLLVFVWMYFNNVDKNIILFFYPFSCFIVSIFYDGLFKSLTKQTIGSNRLELKKLLLFSMPVSLSALIVSLNVSIPRIILSYFDKIDYVATYTMLLYFGSIAIIPIMSMTPIYLSDFSKDYNLTKAKKIFLLINIYASCFAIFILLFGNYFMISIYRINNYDFIDLIYTALIGFIQINLVWLNFLLTSKRSFSRLLNLNFVTLILTLLLSFIFGYFYKMTGILFAVFFANLTFFCFNLYYLVKRG